MLRHHATLSSTWPPEETFDFLSQLSNGGCWSPEVLAAEQLDPGPVRVGTRFRLTVRVLRRRVPFTYVIVSYYRPQAVVLISDQRLLWRVTLRITVQPAAVGATVGYGADMILRGPLRPIGPLLTWRFDRRAGRAAAGLRRMLAQPVSHGARGGPGA